MKEYMNHTKKKLSIADILIYIVLLIFALSCFLPLLNTLALSFSNSAEATAGHVGLIPVGFNLSAYHNLLKETQFWRSFKVSVIRVILGTSLNVFLVVTMAYPLSKNKREFRAQGIYVKLVILAMLFNGGMIPTYLVVQKLGLINTMGALIFPTAVGASNVILMMNFYRSVPKSLEEAAEIDGANPLQILWNIYIPASKPCIATIALFNLVGHWNDYFSGIVYMTKVEKYPLQTYIQSLSANFDISKITDIKKLEELLSVSEKTLSSAKIVVSIIPVLIIYPFLQRYFTTGLVVGAVKE